MPSFNQPRPSVPSWLELLRSAVLSPERNWAAAESLSTLLATRELQAWLADPRRYDGLQQKWSWLSVLADFQHSAGQLGPGLHTVLGSDLAAAVATARSLKTDFDSKSHAEMALALRGRRLIDKAVFDQLSTRWAAVETRAAAWWDLVEACRDTTVGYETLATRRDLLWQLARAGDHDARQLSDFLAGTLAGNAFQVALAKVWLGEISDPKTPMPHPSEHAGLSEDEQLDFCKRLLTASAVPGHYVVWIAYDRADAAISARTLGPISFWSSKWLRATLEKGDGPNWAAVPDELKVTDSMFRLDDLPEEQDVLLARADLRTGAWTDPVRVATEQVESVVALASFRVGNTRWRPIAGYIVAIDDRVRGIGSFHPIISRAEIKDYGYQHAIDAELSDLAPQLGIHLPIPDGSLSETIQAVRWWQQARQQSPLAAVLLHVRVVEVLAHKISVEKWYRYLDDYQRACWVRYQLIKELGQIIHDCLHGPHRLPSAADRQWLILQSPFHI